MRPRLDATVDVSASTTRPSALISVHAAVMLFGVAALFGKWLTLPPWTIVLGRTTVASLALGALMLVRREALGRCDWRLATNGAVLALHWVAFFCAIQVSSVAIGLLGFASFPLFIVVFETAFLRRPIEAVAALASALVVLGLAMLVPAFDLRDATVQGLLWGILSGATFALLTVGNRDLVRRHQATAIAFWQNSIAALCILPMAFADPIALTPHDLLLIALLGIACTALAHTLFIHALRALPAQTAGVIAALEPVYGIALATLLLHEVPTLRMLAGAAIIIGASVLVTLRRTA
jgi:drug/metabolite transporter (DMT)-like permease